MHKLIVLLCCIWLPNSYAHLTVVTENLPSFQHVDSNGKLVGSAAEKVINALERSGLEYTISVNNWPTSYNAALRDNNTCIFSIVRQAVREPLFDWVAELDRFDASFYSFHADTHKISNLEQAKAYRIAILKENFGHHYLVSKGFNEQTQLMLFNSFDNIMDILKSRRDSIDLVVLSDQQYHHQLKIDPTLSALKPIMGLSRAYPPLYFACNKNLDNHTRQVLYDAFHP